MDVVVQTIQLRDQCWQSLKVGREHSLSTADQDVMQPWMDLKQ